MGTGAMDPLTESPVPTGVEEPPAEEDPHAAHEADAPVGPIDWGAWLVSAIGVGAGSLIAVALAVAIQHG